MWARFWVMAINVSRKQISFAFNLGQVHALSAGQAVFDCGPLQITTMLVIIAPALTARLRPTPIPVLPLAICLLARLTLVPTVTRIQIVSQVLHVARLTTNAIGTHLLQATHLPTTIN